MSFQIFIILQYLHVQHVHILDVRSAAECIHCAIFSSLKSKSKEVLYPTCRVHCTSNHLFTCNTDLRIGEEGSTVHTNRPLSQPTTNTEPDNGLK